MQSAANDNLAQLAALASLEVSRARLASEVRLTGTIECTSCGTLDGVAELCCGVACCNDCLPAYLRSTGFTFKCPVNGCGKDVSRLLHSGPVRDAVVRFRQFAEFDKYIDCSVCPRCGALNTTKTFDAHHTCRKCDYEFCFFCKDEWKAGCDERRGGPSSTAMRNGKFGCRPDCTYRLKTTFDLMKFHYQPKGVSSPVMIPGRRMCPKCQTLGAYDDKCKFHNCATCGKTFCFFCLKEQGDCVGYSTKCVTEYPRQEMSLFPWKFTDPKTLVSHGDWTGSDDVPPATKRRGPFACLFNLCSRR